jgi:probable phosphoglycerate mutase
MRLYIVRHGATELNKKHLFNSWIDEPLNDEGREQARDLKNEVPSDAKIIYTSKLKRAGETAEIINEKLNVPIVADQRLNEVNIGNLAGKSFEDMEAENGPAYSKGKYQHLEYDYRPVGGESVDDVRRRVHEVISEIRGGHKNGPILLVVHGGILRLLEHDYNQKFIGDMPNGHIVQIDI